MKYTITIWFPEDNFTSSKMAMRRAFQIFFLEVGVISSLWTVFERGSWLQYLATVIGVFMVSFLGTSMGQYQQKHRRWSLDKKMDLVLVSRQDIEKLKSSGILVVEPKQQELLN